MAEWLVTAVRYRATEPDQRGVGNGDTPGEAYAAALQDLGVDICENCGVIIDAERPHHPETLGRCWLPSRPQKRGSRS